MLIEIVRDPLLLQRVRDELVSAVAPGTRSPAQLDINIPTLCALPLFVSIYKECLRLRASIPMTRRLRNNIEIDGYTLRAGNFILAPSWLSHMDEGVWATPQHPVHSFWAERFLQKGSSSSPDENAKLSAASDTIKAGDFFPYGGGSVICPGRFFAKQEILAAVAMMVMSFDLEYVKNVHLDGTASDRGPGVENCESRGIISLDRDVVVRMRKRATVV